MDDLVKRNNLYYKKFTDVPFTGEISGIEKGKFKNGKRVGLWEYYWKNGQLRIKLSYKDGEFDGLWEEYYISGMLERKGNYKEGELDGLWEFFNEDGSLEKTKTFKKWN